MFDYPIDSASILRGLQNHYKSIQDSQQIIASLQLDVILKEMEESRAITLKKYSLGTRMSDFVIAINIDKIMQLSREFYKDRPTKMPNFEALHNSSTTDKRKLQISQKEASKKADKERFYKLINEPTAIRKIFLRRYEELSQQMATTSEKAVYEAFKSKVVNRIIFCENGTREKCYQIRQNSQENCSKVHFKKIIMPHTDDNLGNCSYLDTCRHMEYCKFVHYKIDEIDEMGNASL